MLFLKKFISWLFTILFLAVIALLLISSFSIPGIPLDARVVQTGSMEPAIKTGSVVFIWPADVYTEGDVITFQRAESKLEAPITHRIISVSVTEGEYVFRTKGDANSAADAESVEESEVFGKVRANVPYLGYALEAARTPWGFAVLIIVPALLIVFEEVKKIWKELKRKPEEGDPSQNV